MPDRRDTLKTLTTLTVLPTVAVAQASAPRYFTVAEVAELAIWTELMIARRTRRWGNSGARRCDGWARMRAGIGWRCWSD